MRLNNRLMCELRSVGFLVIATKKASYSPPPYPGVVPACKSGSLNKKGKTGLYYHYTDINGLHGIMLNKKLWLTDSRFLNDHTEGAEFLFYLDDAFKRLDLTAGDIELTINHLSRLAKKISNYTTSFSLKADLLSQWRGYCPKNGGYCLGFKNLDKEQFEVFGNGSSLKQWLTYPQPCIYSQDKKRELANNIAIIFLEWLKGDKSKEPLRFQFLSQFHQMVMSYKSSHFQEESEFRAIVQIHDDPAATPLFRTKSNMVVPYLELRFQPTTLEEIIIGPSQNKKLANLGLREFLKSLGPDFEHIRIRHSSIPYRDI